MTVALDKPAVAGLRLIPLDLLDASPRNPRRTMDDKSLEELAASIKQSGINQPLLVRPEPMDGLVEMRYEIVCGHRRSEAATILGLLGVPCIVREMDDGTAAEIALVDNLQRVDVPALEEAEAFGLLLARHGTVEAVAARVGKDVSHVAKRLKLRALGAWQRDALRQSLITVDHALLLARLDVEEQDAALKWCLDRNAGSKTSVDKVIKERADRRIKERDHSWHWEPETVQRLKEHIEQSSGRRLSRAPWSLDDESLVEGAAACNVCPSNTKANTALFADLNIEAATCADGVCFEQKRAAFVRIRMRTADNDKQAPLRLSWKFTGTSPRMEQVPICQCAGNKNCKSGTGCRGPKLDQVFKAGQWIEAKKGSCDHLRAGVTVDWSDANDRGFMGSSSKLRKPGELISVCVSGSCKAHKKEWEKSKGENRNSGYQRPDPAEEKKRNEQQAHLEKVETEVRLRLFKAILSNLDAARAIHMLADEDGQAPKIRKKLLDWFPKLSGVDLEALTLLWSGHDRDLDPNGYYLMQPGGVAGDRKQLWALAKSAGIDADQVTVKYFDETGVAPASASLVPKIAAKKTAAKKAVKPSIKKAAKPRPPVRPAQKAGRK